MSGGALSAFREGKRHLKINKLYNNKQASKLNTHTDAHTQLCLCWRFFFFSRKAERTDRDFSVMLVEASNQPTANQIKLTQCNNRILETNVLGNATQSHHHKHAHIYTHNTHTHTHKNTHVYIENSSELRAS